MKTKPSILGFALILFVLLAVGCGRKTDQPTEVPIATTEEIPTTTPTDVPTVAPTAVPSAIPTEVEGEVSEWVLPARQSTLDYISEQYGEEAPALHLAWTGGITDPETPTVGWSEYQFFSGDWLITIGHPVVPPELTVYQVAVTNQATGFEWEGEVDVGGEVTEILGPASEQLALCWYGRVESTPEYGAIDRYLVLLPEEARSAVDLVGVDETVEAEIEALRDSGTFAHFWGTLDCSVTTWGGCQLVVDRLRPEGPEGPIFDPEPVVGWMGRIISNPTGAQFDDYFEQSARFRKRYGIEGADDDIDAQLTSLRDAASIIRVWGQVMCPVVDVQGSQIQVDRIEVVMEASTGEGYEGWKPYLNADFGYAVWYPGEYTVMGNNPNEDVTFSPQGRSGSRFIVLHYDSDFFHPPAGVDLQQWLTDHTSYDAIDTEVEIAGLPAVHLSNEAGPGWSVSDEYYFIKGDHLYRIYILPDGDQQDWDLYNKFLQSFTFNDETESTGSAVEGWTGTICRFPIGSQYKYYFERTDERQFLVGAATEAVNQQIEDAAWTGAQIELWGQLGPEMPNHINVTRLEIVSEPSIEARNLSPFAVPSVSSVLPSDRLGTYHEWSAINGLLESPWCEGAAGSGVGQWLMLEFPALLELAYIGIDVGYDYDDDIFFKNNRIKKATFFFSDGTELPWEFDDERGLQLVPLACAPGPCTQTTFVKLVIDEVYPGSLYDDACIAEIEVWGMPG